MSPTLAPIVVLIGIASRPVSDSPTNFCTTSLFQATLGLRQFWVHSQETYHLTSRRLQPARWNLEDSQTTVAIAYYSNHRFNSLNSILELNFSSTKNRGSQAGLKQVWVANPFAIGRFIWSHLIAARLTSNKRRWSQINPGQRPNGQMLQPFPLFNSFIQLPLSQESGA